MATILGPKLLENPSELGELDFTIRLAVSKKGIDSQWQMAWTSEAIIIVTNNDRSMMEAAIYAKLSIKEYRCCYPDRCSLPKKPFLSHISCAYTHLLTFRTHS
jgi:hypothetical protein